MSCSRSDSIEEGDSEQVFWSLVFITTAFHAMDELGAGGAQIGVGRGAHRGCMSRWDEGNLTMALTHVWVQGSASGMPWGRKTQPGDLVTFAEGLALILLSLLEQEAFCLLDPCTPAIPCTQQERPSVFTRFKHTPIFNQHQHTGWRRGLQ